MVTIKDQILFVERELRIWKDLLPSQPSETLINKTQTRIDILEALLKTLTTVYEKELSQ